MADFLSMLPSLFGGVTKAYGAYSEGAAADAEAKFEAKQMMINAGQAKAVAQRDAIEQTRQSGLVQSRILALAAASGGGASDPTIINLIGKQAGQGAYNAAVAIYKGDDRARELEMAAAAKRYEGASAKSAGIAKAVGALTGTASSLFSKYAQSGPGLAAPADANPYPEMDAWGSGEFK